MTDKAWHAVIAWALVIGVATSIPAFALPSARGWAHTDKLVHGLLYAVLAMLAARGVVHDRGRLDRGGTLTVLGGVMVFAAADEWHQIAIPGRSASLADWGADAAGAAVGLTIFLMARARQETKES